MMKTKIKFGTDGWRAIIADDFTVYNVARVTQGLSVWLLSNNANPKVVIGHDCRFGGELFAQTAANILCANGIQVLLSKGFVSTPMVSYGVLHYQANQGVVITASHNPASYNGYKLKGEHGGPSSPDDINAVEILIPEDINFVQHDLTYWEDKGLLEYIDLEQTYIDYLNSKFDFFTLDKAPYKLAYDAMYGAGQNVIRRVLPSAVLLNCEYNPGFNNVAPEPLHKNLLTLSKTISDTPELKMGLATDGDADRIGLYDEEGNFIDAHHIILLLIHYLHKYKKLSGKVVVAFSATDKIRTMCEAYGLPYEVTKIGFKYISEKMIMEDVLVGGEESGGIAIKGHIPERDGIFDGLVLYEFMLETGKTIKQLCEEIYEIVGRFYYLREDMHLDEEVKVSIMKNAQNGKYTEFGKYKITKTEDLDGIKYHINNGGWIMFRASGTEPVLRIYIEGRNDEEAQDMLFEVKNTLFRNATLN